MSSILKFHTLQSRNLISGNTDITLKVEKDFHKDILDRVIYVRKKSQKPNYLIGICLIN